MYALDSHLCRTLALSCYLHRKHRQKEPEITPQPLLYFIFWLYIMTFVFDTVFWHRVVGGQFESPDSHCKYCLYNVVYTLCAAVRSSVMGVNECSYAQPDPTNYVNVCKPMKLQDLSFPFLFQTSYIIPICLVWYVQGVCKFLATTDVE